MQTFFGMSPVLQNIFGSTRNNVSLSEWQLRTVFHENNFVILENYDNNINSSSKNNAGGLEKPS